MAANKHSYLEIAILNHFLRQTPTSSPTHIYAALYTTTPTKTTSGVEVSGGSYARVQIDNGSSNFTAPSGSPSSTSNGAAITFPTATASWGLVEGCAICDQAVGGNILYFGPLTASKTVDIGDTVTFATGALTVQES